MVPLLFTTTAKCQQRLCLTWAVVKDTGSYMQQTCGGTPSSLDWTLSIPLFQHLIRSRTSDWFEGICKASSILLIYPMTHSFSINYKFPFPDDTFDFVRMANLALCIPYDKWDFVLSQVHRVLTPGGRLELIDDDIYFPYGEWKGVELEAVIPGSPLCGEEAGMKLGENE